MSGEPPPWAPRTATTAAKRLWLQPLAEKWDLLMNPSEGNARLFIRAGIESFDAASLQHAIENDIDVVPLIVAALKLDNDWIRPWAKTALRIWWQKVYIAGSDVPRILAEISTHDPPKGVLLNTPRGRVWLNATVWNMLNFFRGYAEIKGEGAIAPPLTLPDRLRRKALQAGTHIFRTRRPHPDARGERAPGTSSEET